MLNWRQCSRLIPVVVILGLSGFVCVQYYRCWQLDEDPMTRTTLLLSLLVVLWPLCYFLLIAIARYWLYRETRGAGRRTAGLHGSGAGLQ